MTARFALAGSPIAHSLSPAMQNAALATLDMDAHYELRVTELGDVPALVAEMRAGVWHGCNVTTPLKTAVAPYCVCDALAQRAGAVNTIWMAGTELRGALTDVDGIREPLSAHGAARLFSRTPGEAVVIGAGGAARAAVLALEALGARVSVAARDPAKAADVLQLLSVTQRGDALPLGELARMDGLADAQVVVQATSLGRAGESLPLRWPAAPIIAFEMLYTPRETPFVSAARAAGGEVIEGWEMLLAQGARSLSLWLGGREAPIDVMRVALLRALG